LLSVGTGNVATPESVPPDKVFPRRGIQAFIQRFIRLGNAAILEDMNSETLWQDFIEGFGTDDSAEERLKGIYG
jgi:hypothetical protein